MVVTQSREHALHYFFAIKKYIHDNKYTGINALVAFSGEIDLDGEKYTETDINRFKETELPDRFNGIKKDGSLYEEQYHLLIVAEKYQTGFDQPKLCAMYIDRKLDALQAVQTLSRVNRTASGKEQTYILDFQNTIEEIQNAFRPYYDVTSLEAITDPNQIYELEGRIRAFSFIDETDLNQFAEMYYKRELEAKDRIKLEELIKAAVRRFEDEEDERRREEFRQLLKSYMRFYSFVSQVIKLEDTSLEKLFAFSSWLSRLLPNRVVPPDIELTPDMLRLQVFRIEKKEQGSASLIVSEPPTPLYAIQAFGANPYTEDEERSLSEIIESFNQRHGTEFSKEDFLRFEQVNQEILRDDNLKDMLRKNPSDVVFNAFSQAFFEGLIKLFQRDNQFQNIVMADSEARNQAIKHFFSRALREARSNI